jgi:GT2 family glycosyltransferase
MNDPVRLPASAEAAGFTEWTLQPGPSVQPAGAGVWAAADDSPFFLIASPSGAPAAGVYAFRMAFPPDTPALAMRLSLDRGQGYAPLPDFLVPAAQGEGVIAIPGETVSIRLQPAAQVGRFALAGVSLRRMNLVETVVHIVRSKGPRRRAMKALLTRGAIAAIGILEAPANLPDAVDYADWIAANEPPAADEAPKIRAHIASLRHRPLISVATPAFNSSPAHLKAAIESVRGQVYENWELCIVDDASPSPEVWALIEEAARADPRIKAQRLEANAGIAGATNAALAMATGEWVAFLDHDDLIRPDALALVADAVVRNPHARIVYTDEDKIDDTGRRHDPYMKGGWNRELFYSQNLLNHLTVVRRDVLQAAGPLRPEFDGSQDYDLMLRCLEQVGDDAIIHLPFVCYHWRFAARAASFSQTQGERALAAAIRALQEHFVRTGAPADAARASPSLGYTRARWRLDPKPLVSLIIPTRDRKDLLETAIGSIRKKTAYPNYEILVVDNDSRSPATLDYLAALECDGAARIVRAPGPFNFSRINNLAVGSARGAILGFINNDIEALDPDWLGEMVSHFARSDVGAVGAKLFYPDGRIQHAGVVTGIGEVAGHLYKYAPGDAPGPSSHLMLPRETTAATAACLLVRADLFGRIGGFDEAGLAVAFNDVDLCLRIRKAGARIVWTPFARLVHHESVSRGIDTDPAKHARFRRETDHMLATWGEVLRADPCYSPNLTLVDESGGLAAASRARRPWS